MMLEQMGSEGFSMEKCKAEHENERPNKKRKGDGLVVEHLPRMNEVPGSITSIKRKEK